MDVSCLVAALHHVENHGLLAYDHTRRRTPLDRCSLNLGYVVAENWGKLCRTQKLPVLLCNAIVFSNIESGNVCSFTGATACLTKTCRTSLSHKTFLQGENSPFVDFYIFQGSLTSSSSSQWACFVFFLLNAG